MRSRTVQFPFRFIIVPFLFRFLSVPIVGVKSSIVFHVYPRGCRGACLLPYSLFGEARWRTAATSSESYATTHERAASIAKSVRLLAVTGSSNSHVAVLARADLKRYMYMCKREDNEDSWMTYADIKAAAYHPRDHRYSYELLRDVDLR